MPVFESPRSDYLRVLQEEMDNLAGLTPEQIVTNPNFTQAIVSDTIDGTDHTHPLTENLVFHALVLLAAGFREARPIEGIT